MGGLDLFGRGAGVEGGGGVSGSGRTGLEIL